MLEPLARLAARLMNGVRVNRLERSIQHGKSVVVKRRRAGAGIVIWFGNLFLALARSGVRMFVHADPWMDWEVHCASLLYPDRPPVVIGPGNSVCMAEVSGASLRQLLARGEADCQPISAAARELRRVHRLQCRYFGSGWSHGDLHLDNILYDSAADRATLLDFDTRHESGIDATQRHADDLQVFLLELITLADDRWLELATALLEEYHEPAVLAELSRQLFVPRGFAKILWYTRTSGRPRRRTEPRLESLRNAIQHITSVDR